MNMLEAITKVRCLIDDTDSIFSKDSIKEVNKAFNFILDKIDNQRKEINVQKADNRRLKDVVDDYIKAKTKFRKETESERP